MHTFLLVTESNFKTMRFLFHNFMLSLNFHRNLLECHRNGKSGEQCVDQISKLHPRQRTKTLGKLQSFCFVCIQYLGDRYWVFRLTPFILICVQNLFKAPLNGRTNSAAIITLEICSCSFHQFGHICCSSWQRGIFQPVQYFETAVRVYSSDQGTYDA